MTESPDLDAALFAATAMVDHAKWGLRLRIVSTIRLLEWDSPDGWARIGYRELAARLGCSARYTHNLIGPHGVMWEVEWVLKRGPVGAGHRGTAYRVNPPEHWRKVPWLEGNRELRLLRLGQDYRAPHRGADPPLEPRSMVAALRVLEGAPEWFRAAIIAALNPVDDSLAPRSNRVAGRFGDPQSRDGGPFGTGNRGANRSVSGVSVVEGEPPAGGGVEGGPDGVNSVVSLSTAAPRERGEASQRLTQAIEAKTGKPCFGRLVDKIERLTTRHDLEVLLAAVADASADLLPPGVVGHCEGIATGRLHLNAAGGPARLDEFALRRQAITLARMVQQIEHDGGEVPERLQAEVAECQTRLDAIQEEA